MKADSFSSLVDAARTAYGEQQKVVDRLRQPSETIRVQSKRSITLVRRGKHEEAEKILVEVEKILKDLAGVLRAVPSLQHIGFYNDAAEEYVEARALYHAVMKTPLKAPKNLAISPETVLGGICDMTGELVRRAVTIATPGQVDEITRYRDLAADIAERMVTVGFSGKLRSKFDDVERNLQRLESILYDLRTQ